MIKYICSGGRSLLTLTSGTRIYPFPEPCIVYLNLLWMWSLKIYPKGRGEKNDANLNQDIQENIYTKPGERA